MKNRCVETDEMKRISVHEQFGIKLLEVILLRDDIEYYGETEESVTFLSYQKAIQEVVSMFCEFYEIGSKDEFVNLAFQTFYKQSRNYIIRGDLEILLTNTISYGNECVLRIGNPDLVQDFTECIEMIIEQLRALKKEAMMRRVTLQKRQKQLEELRQEAQELSEAERLIELKASENSNIE